MRIIAYQCVKYVSVKYVSVKYVTYFLPRAIAKSALKKHPSVQLPESLSPFGGLRTISLQSQRGIYIYDNHRHIYLSHTVLKPERFRVSCAFGDD